MRNSGLQTIAHEEQDLCLCTFFIGTRMFGIDTASIREVLGARRVERVPLAPVYVAGVVPYRGEVVAAICGPGLLSFGDPMKQRPADPCVLVLEEGDGDAAGSHQHGAKDRFALVVDRVGGVLNVDRRSMDPNPPTADAISRHLFVGAFRTGDGLVVQIAASRLNPVRLARSGWFADAENSGRMSACHATFERSPEKRGTKENRCEH